MDIALFGGSFNPPHVGHAMACHYVLYKTFASSLYILPVYNHPLGKKMLPFEHRMNMCRLLFNHHTKFPNVRVVDWEKNNPSGKTINLVKKIVNSWTSGVKIKWIIGSDCMVEKDNWEGFDEVERLVELIPVGRFNMMGEDILSSTDIRRSLFLGKDHWGLPKDVLSYIQVHKLNEFFTEDGGIKNER